MKWPEVTCKIVESFNKAGRPGFALAALVVLMMSLLTAALVASLWSCRLGSAASAALKPWLG